MAGFYQHVTVSTALGVGYGAAAYFGFEIDWATCAIAGGLTGLAGMLPDLDSPSGQPVREVFGVAAALLPMLVMKRLGVVVGLLPDWMAEDQKQLSPEAMVVVMAACYFAIRLGGAWLLNKLTVHRGMFHSIPAALIAALAAFLIYDVPSTMLRLFLAGGTLLGFLSHLLMDELWSVKWDSGNVALKKSAGTAFKLFSGSIPATLATYTILLALSGLTLCEGTLGQRFQQLRDQSDVRQMASEFMELFRR